MSGTPESPTRMPARMSAPQGPSARISSVPKGPAAQGLVPKGPAAQGLAPKGPATQGLQRQIELNRAVRAAEALHRGAEEACARLERTLDGNARPEAVLAGFRTVLDRLAAKAGAAAPAAAVRRARAEVWETYAPRVLALARAAVEADSRRVLEAELGRIAATALAAVEKAAAGKGGFGAARRIVPAFAALLGRAVDARAAAGLLTLPEAAQQKRTAVRALYAAVIRALLENPATNAAALAAWNADAPFAPAAAGKAAADGAGTDDVGTTFAGTGLPPEKTAGTGLRRLVGPRNAAALEAFSVRSLGRRAAAADLAARRRRLGELAAERRAGGGK